jgi:hypothetical protein
MVGGPEAPEGRSASTRTKECQGLTQHDGFVGQYPGTEPRSKASSDGERSGTAGPELFAALGYKQTDEARAANAGACWTGFSPLTGDQSRGV